MIETQYRELFGVPIYKFKYPKHFETKQLFLNYFNNDNNFDRSSNEELQNTFFTSANLHKEQVFNPLVDFINICLTQSFTDMGFEPSFDITSMWGVKQKKGGSHNKHIHSNTFLVGVYYLDGNIGSKGTTFHSPYNFQNMIVPRKIPGKITKPNHNRMIFFEEGSVIVFPAWLEHEVPKNETDKERNIIAFNCMPVGITNNAKYDRYNYQSVENTLT